MMLSDDVELPKDWEKYLSDKDKSKLEMILHTRRTNNAKKGK